MVMCFVPDCKHYSEKHGCRFFTFPKERTEKAKWLKLIRREDREPSRYSLVCSCHFKDGKRENRPTIFERNVGKQIEIEAQKKRQRKETEHKEVTVPEEPQPGPSGLQTKRSSPSEEMIEEPQPGQSEVEKKCSVPSKMLEAENYLLQIKIEELTMKLNCTEIFCVHPSSMEKQRATFSAYKHHNTVKVLIGVAPNGVITYVSQAYPGSISDKKIVQNTGIVNQFVPGDLILADKGFLIADLMPQGVSLNIPPFLCTAQFTPQQVVLTRTIARARIHVERAITRITNFKILTLIPATLLPHSSLIIQTCAALTNLQFPLIREVEDLYKE